ncbi:MAG: GAF domain-containing sensor histidine kinase [Gaiellales bacterium]
MGLSIPLSALGELGERALRSSSEAIAEVGALVQRVTGIDITVVSEVTPDGRYVFRSLEKKPALALTEGDDIPWEWSLCSRVHAGEAPPSVSEVRDHPSLWASWLRLKESLAVDWDIRAFCTHDVRLPDGRLFGTLCLHHREPRVFSDDENALLAVLSRLVGQEIWRERAAAQLADSVAALEAAARERVELADELRHELRAPLAVIDGYAEGMLDGVVKRDDEHVVLVRREATRATRLLDDLVELARLEAAPRSPTEACAVAEVVREMHVRLEPLAVSAGVTLRTELSTAVVAVDRRRLEQVVVNLVRNALRAVGDGSGSEAVLFVRPAELDGRAAVAIGVEDDGPGLPDGERERIFERFFRGRSGRDAGEGSGLGLTVVRRIAESAGGRAVAEPCEPQGLRVAAVLPCVEPGAGEGHSAVEAGQDDSLLQAYRLGCLGNGETA